MSCRSGSKAVISDSATTGRRKNDSQSGARSAQKRSYSLEEIVAHEGPRGSFIVITNARGGTERYAIDDPMTKAYLAARGLDWR